MLAVGEIESGQERLGLHIGLHDDLAVGNDRRGGEAPLEVGGVPGAAIHGTQLQLPAQLAAISLEAKETVGAEEGHDRAVGSGRCAVGLGGFGVTTEGRHGLDGQGVPKHFAALGIEREQTELGLHQVIGGIASAVEAHLELGLVARRHGGGHEDPAIENHRRGMREAGDGRLPGGLFELQGQGQVSADAARHWPTELGPVQIRGGLGRRVGSLARGGQDEQQGEERE